MIIRREIVYISHPFKEHLWDLIRDEWRLIYLQEDRDLTFMMSLVSPYLKEWEEALTSKCVNELSLSLLSYFPNPEKILKRTRLAVSNELLSLSDLQYIMIKVLRCRKKVFARVSSRQSAFFLHRFFLFALKDWVRSLPDRFLPPSRRLCSSLYEEPYTEQPPPSLFPISPLTELYVNSTEVELADLLQTTSVDAGRRKRRHLLKLKKDLKGL